MSLMHKTIEQINEDDLIYLKESEVQESRVIEYKEMLPSDQEEAKKEFLADVSSFANAGGGDILFGVSATKGVPTSFPGLDIDDIDSVILKYENLIRTGVEPRIFGIQTQAIPLSNKNIILVIRIPNSFNSPHMMTLKKSQKFFTRNSAGKHQMDITEIRSSFLNTSVMSHRIRDFQAERNSLIQINEASVSLLNNSCFITLHLIPYNAWGNQLYDLTRFHQEPTTLPPLYGSISDFRFNLEGFVTFSKFSVNEHPHSYVQIFRNGIIEAVDKGMIKVDSKKNLIPSVAFEKNIIEKLNRYFIELKNLRIVPPVVLLLSVNGIKNFKLAVSPEIWGPDNDGFTKNNILLPEVIFETFPENPYALARSLKPLFDTFWNAGGWSKSMNYDEQGEWNPGQ
ncbi:AlbA family DNA-binding domain-containing protein [Paenibacillus rhizoplanae]|uniref:Helix-turn-helix domain-containing protein n=1 Tax=Paenibacillus rhizoplanae TaxID=1917181 RepID=A0ABW5FEE0_9BACL